MTTTDRVILDLLNEGSRDMSELSGETGLTMAAIRVALEGLVAQGRVIACAHTQTYWLRRKGTMVVRAA